MSGGQTGTDTAWIEGYDGEIVPDTCDPEAWMWLWGHSQHARRLPMTTWFANAINAGYRAGMRDALGEDGNDRDTEKE